MSSLAAFDPASLEFLRESNAIEEITNIDYSNEGLQSPGAGHYGALCQAVEAGQRCAQLTVDVLCQWQGMLVAEQRAFGHEAPESYLGRLRGVSLPINVHVGGYQAPSFVEVAGALDEWALELNRTITRWRPSCVEDVEVVTTLGSFFQRFEAIHPFGDGNGRTGRLILAYLCVRAGIPLVVIRASERPGYYAAHRSKLAMQLFIAEKIRERVRWLDGSILARVEQFDFADRYAATGGESGLLVERHSLVEAMAEWRARLAAR